MDDGTSTFWNFMHATGYIYGVCVGAGMFWRRYWGGILIGACFAAIIVWIDYCDRHPKRSCGQKAKDNLRNAKAAHDLNIRQRDLLAPNGDQRREKKRG